MSSEAKIQDVIIIGGGPAGSTAATFLAKQGLKVTVLEKESFPRDHVGESLLPFCYDIFEQLGVLGEMTRRFVRKPGVRFVDVDGIHQTTWCFNHVIKDASHLSFHVSRPEFDQLLLDNARQRGVTVREKTRVRTVDLDHAPNEVSLLAEGPDGASQNFRGRFLLDASGRDTFLASHMRSKTPHPALNRAGLYGYWSNARYIAGLDEGVQQVIYLGGEKKGWVWLIPLGLERLSVGLVLNSAYIRQRKAQLSEQGTADWPLQLYEQELLASKFVQDILTGAKLIQSPIFTGDYSYTIEKKYGSNFAMIGDAATFLDPIFSSGVFMAMNSARLVSQVLPIILDNDKSAEPANLEPLADVFTRINGAYTLLDKAIRMFYNPVAINLAEAGSATRLIHQNHEDAMATGHYMLAGDFFDRHETYSEFIDLLQNPEFFKKYKQFVIDRPNFKADATCGVNQEQAFPS